MKITYVLLIVITVSSCIPIKIAPKIKDYKIVVAKKFKRQLPKTYAFIFKDTKAINEFYNYINTKYQLNNVGYNVPITINKAVYYLAFYEICKSNETINILPIIVDSALGSDAFNSTYKSKKGNWYLVLTVKDGENKDALHPQYKYQNQVEKYLKQLKTEYLTTTNYQELLFQPK